MKALIITTVILIFAALLLVVFKAKASAPQVSPPNQSKTNELARSLQSLSVSEAKQLQVILTAESVVDNSEPLDCHGITKQGGMVICETAPFARVEIGRAEDDTYTQSADSNGIIIIGFDRDEPAAFARTATHRVNFAIDPREYDTSIINGLPSNMVNEYSESDLKRIRAATARKKVGFASKVEEIGFRDGFIYPVTDHIKTTNFGAQRILNGEPKSPHFGVDLAAPKGTPILAPAGGIVSLADDDMYFEGSLIMIDHGQGLISYYLHNEDVMVTEGQRVTQGQQIGTVGSRGRSTGPHLCWRLKWRGRNLDPELLTEWPTHG
jgi:murein DD-endopeptidase MepM/ murein hydrolase activator NlpD